MHNIIKKIYHFVMPNKDIDKKIYKYYKKMQKSNNSFMKNYYKYKIEKKYQCSITPGAILKGKLKIQHPNGIHIGAGSIIGKNVTIYQQVTIGQNHNNYPVIEDGVIIYAGAKIIGNVKIGKNSIIGANAVVTKNIPDNSIWGGVPAKEIKKRDPKEKYI